MEEEKKEEAPRTCAACLHRKLCGPRQRMISTFWDSQFAYILRPGTHTREFEAFLGGRCVYFIPAKKEAPADESDPS